MLGTGGCRPEHQLPAARGDRQERTVVNSPEHKKAKNYKVQAAHSMVLL